MKNTANTTASSTTKVTSTQIKVRMEAASVIGRGSAGWTERGIGIVPAHDPTYTPLPLPAGRFT
jgi:hypothetical protein